MIYSIMRVGGARKHTLSLGNRLCRMMRKIVQILKVLSHPDRLRLAIDLLAGERCVSELADRTGLPASTVSQHLVRLRDSGVVGGRRCGQRVYYRVAQRDFQIVQLISEVAQAFGSNHPQDTHRSGHHTSA